MKLSISLSPSVLIRHVSIAGLLLLAASFIAFIIKQFIYIPNNLDGIGYTDIIEYWSAYKIWKSAGNPYDDQLMLQIQSTVRPSEYAIMMWNPPWLLSIFSPLLRISDFVKYAGVWFMCSIAAYLFGAWYLIRSVSSNHIKSINLWICIITFAPFLSVLSFGQIGSWLFLGVALIIIGINKKSPLTLALGGILVSLKPHLFLVFLLSCILILVRRKNWFLLSSLLLGPLSIAVLTEFISDSGIITIWLKTILGITPPILTPQPNRWLTTTIPSVLSDMLAPQNQSFRLSVSLISLITSLLISIAAIRSLKTEVALVVSLAVSIALGPFGWLYDYTTMAAAIIVLWPSISKDSRYLNLLLSSLLILLISSTMLIKQLDQALLPLLLTIAIMLNCLTGNEKNKLVL